ncbi:photosynthetic NDH subunit of lumenal location 3, chloroplastic-like [Phragmites australis]|uniref:photosynthetic NDH subunit of lumenal location 3, chloroplastic-like n=1 Tax=Phragmites australis TaxID=29695 RepID=UPI002D769D8E|nr:photosynthetic NDH subunit of lumenal location 3, chloroplastic-like [Phragmites australis]
MDQGMELKGCVCRIKSSAAELLSMEEDLVTDLDDGLWDLVRRDLQLKATFLYVDLSRVISRCEGKERRKALTLLANEFFDFMDELGDAVATRSISVVKACYGDAARALREVVAAVAPPAAV